MHVSRVEFTRGDDPVGAYPEAPDEYYEGLAERDRQEIQQLMAVQDWRAAAFAVLFWGHRVERLPATDAYPELVVGPCVMPESAVEPMRAAFAVHSVTLDWVLPTEWFLAGVRS
jgi:hypothetical protein